MMFTVYLVLIAVQAALLYAVVAWMQPHKKAPPRVSDTGEKLMPWASLNEIKNAGVSKEVKPEEHEFEEAA